MSNFVLKGRWHGEPHDDARRFTGTVVDGGHTGLAPGAVVTVTFECDRYLVRTDPAHAHGAYRLEGLPSDGFVLSGFIRKDGVLGHDAGPDGDEQLWGGNIFS